MKTNKTAIALIKHFEGFRESAYYCAGDVLTIGYGHTGDVKPDQTTTEKEAEDLLKKDLKWAEDGLNGVLTELETSLPQNQFDALVCLIFNVGLQAFKDSSLPERIMEKEDLSDRFLDWNKVGNDPALGLTRRRLAERAIYKGEQDWQVYSQYKEIRLTNPFKKDDFIAHTQKLLSTKGLEVEADGIYGHKTYACVKAWQTQMGLTVDGIVGIETIRSLT